MVFIIKNEVGLQLQLICIIMLIKITYVATLKIIKMMKLTNCLFTELLCVLSLKHMDLNVLWRFPKSSHFCTPEIKFTWI